MCWVFRPANGCFTCCMLFSPGVNQCLDVNQHLGVAPKCWQIPFLISKKAARKRSARVLPWPIWVNTVAPLRIDYGLGLGPVVISTLQWGSLFLPFFFTWTGKGMKMLKNMILTANGMQNTLLLVKIHKISTLQCSSKKIMFHKMAKLRLVSTQGENKNKYLQQNVLFNDDITNQYFQLSNCFLIVTF